MEDVAMEPVGLVMDRQLTVQQPANAMAGPVAAEAGVTRISTPVSMSVVDLIMLDHNCTRAMFDAYRAPSVTMEQKQLLAWEMIMSLSAHAAKEELVVYPVVRSTLGAAMADKLTGDHQLMKNLLATLDTFTADNPNFDMQLRASMDQVVAHMQDEETTLLPQLAAVLDVETQLRLGILFEAAKVRAPTRPHPEILTTALPARFYENQLAATKLVDASLDQARMPALAPTAVGLSPLASAAVMSSAMNSAVVSANTSAMDSATAAAAAAESAGMGGAGAVGVGGEGGVSVPQSMGMPAMQAAGTAAGTGGSAQQPDVMGLFADDAGPLGAGVDPIAVPYQGSSMGASYMNMMQGLGDEDGGLVAAGEDGAAVVPDYTDVGVGGVAGEPTEEEGADAEMGAAGGMPGDLTGVVNATVPPAGATGEVGGGFGGGGGGVGGESGASGGQAGGSFGGVKKPRLFADDIDDTNVELVKDVGEQDLAPAGLVE